jgi:hypothetical protein
LLPIITAISRHIPPEEFELTHRRRELAEARAELAEREVALGHLRDQVLGFEARYIRQVGVLYRQLDEVEEKLAELQVKRESLEERDDARAAYRRAHPEYDPHAAQEADEAVSAVRNAEVNVKLLFRELAKRIHPDFASDELDAQRRTQLMAQANEAFFRGDAALLERMIDGYDARGEAFGRTNPAAELLRVEALIKRVLADIAVAEQEHTALAKSEMAELRRQTTEAALGGRDLLAEMAARVKGMLGNAMRRYEYESSPQWRPPVVKDPEALLTAETRPAARPVFQRFR